MYGRKVSRMLMKFVTPIGGQESFRNYSTTVYVSSSHEPSSFPRIYIPMEIKASWATKNPVPVSYELIIGGFDFQNLKRDITTVLCNTSQSE